MKDPALKAAPEVYMTKPGLTIHCGCGHIQHCKHGEVSLRKHAPANDPTAARTCNLPLSLT